MESPKVTVRCPKCGEGTPQPIVKLETADEIACPRCGFVVDLSKKHWQVAFGEIVDESGEIEPKSPG